jgi:hypothetical protein
MDCEGEAPKSKGRQKSKGLGSPRKCGDAVVCSGVELKVGGAR